MSKAILTMNQSLSTSFRSHTRAFDALLSPYQHRPYRTHLIPRLRLGPLQTQRRLLSSSFTAEHSLSSPWRPRQCLTNLSPGWTPSSRSRTLPTISSRLTLLQHQNVSCPPMFPALDTPPRSAKTSVVHTFRHSLSIPRLHQRPPTPSHPQLNSLLLTHLQARLPWLPRRLPKPLAVAFDPRSP